MKRVPTKLKQLAESRARVAGELIKCNRLLDPLAEQVSSLKRQLIPAEERLEQLEKQMANAAVKLASIDEAILKIAPTVNPKKKYSAYRCLEKQVRKTWRFH